MEKIFENKVVKINDLGTDKYFKIIPLGFDDFYDAMDLFAELVQGVLLKDGLKIKIREYLPVLLKAVLPLDAEGKNVVWAENKPFTYNDAKAMFQNPVALLELAVEVAKHQQGFFKDSAIFQDLMNLLQGKGVMKSSEFATKSEV